MEEKNMYQKRVTLCDADKYRWVYEVNLLHNPIFFFQVWRIFFFIFLGVSAVVLISDAAKWGMEKAVENLPFLGYFLIGITAVVGMGYLIYAVIMGGKYTVEFDMDENGFVHRQIESQARKAKNIGHVTMLTGAASGSTGAIGAGASAQRTEMYTEFSKVKKVKSYPHRHVIKVKETLEHNQVYVPGEDFEFVLNFIISHCSNIKE